GFSVAPTPTPGETPQDARTEMHQFRDRFPPQQYFISRMRPNPAFAFSQHPANLARIPAQTVWGFNLGGESPGDVATVPGPTIVSRYGTPIVVRRFNELAPDDSGFGRTEVSTHLHNFHT